MKKAQIKESMTTILFILIAVTVLILGYQGIQGLLTQSCEAQKANFIKEIPSLLDKYDDYGSVHKETLNLPCDYRAICFANNSIQGGIETDNIETKPDMNLGQNDLNVLKSANTSKQNIFLIGEFTEAVASSNKVQLSGSTEALCLQAQGGVVEVTFKGRGQKTLVEG